MDMKNGTSTLIKNSQTIKNSFIAPKKTRKPKRMIFVLILLCRQAKRI